MKILITNVQLDQRTGTEIVTRDLDAELRRRGHNVCVYTPRPGGIATEIGDAGGFVVDNIADVPFTPDVIHGHHHVPTVEAMVRFPSTPAIFVCHDRFSPQDSMPVSPSLHHYVAVDLNCRERLIEEGGVDPDSVRLIYNAVDLTRFVPNRPPPERPQRAALFGNNAVTGGFLDAVSAACADAGIALDVFGSGVGRSIDAPERTLGNYDLVFAKARCALEATAAGCAVILIDRAGLGGIVTENNVATMRDWNFGARCLQRPITPLTVANEIARFDAADAANVTQWIWQRSGLGAAVDAYEACYRDALAQPPQALRQTRSWVEAYERLVARSDGLERLLRSADELIAMPPLPPTADVQLQLTIVSVPKTAVAGSTFVLQVQLHNGSTERLASAGWYPVRLTYRWIDDGTGEVIEAEGQRTDLTKTVGVGAVHAQAMTVLAPPTACRAVLRVTLVQERLRWFDGGTSPVIADIPIEVRVGGPSPWKLLDIAALVNSRTSRRDTHTTRFNGVDSAQTVMSPEMFTVVRDAPVDNLGFLSSPLPNMLTFAESAAFLRRAIECRSTTSVIVPPEMVCEVPEHIGVVTSVAPRQAFIEAHHQLLERSSFYGAQERSQIDRRARIHPRAFVDPENVRIGADVEIGPNAVVLGPAVIGRGTRIGAGVVLGSSGFQTVTIDGHLCEMRHAGGVVIGSGCEVFANGVIGRGLFRQQTTIADGCRIGNTAFVSHNADIGRNSFVGHGALINGNVTIGADAWVGPGAVVANNLSIGARARVSLGCTVMADVADDAHVTGPSAVDHWTMLRAMGRLRASRRGSA